MTKHSAPAPKLATHVAVILRSQSHPGIKACGGYAADRVHTVPVAEAMRLVTNKRFEFVTPGDRVACEESLAAAAAAAAKEKE
jgi:hypothetical protein